jgi:hypothetical protein
MPKATFFRILSSAIPAKGDDLRQQIAALNQGQPADEIFLSNPTDFAAIPGTPFAYWISPVIQRLFLTHPRFEQDGRIARVGDHPGDHERYVRLFWEITKHDRGKGRVWIPYQKGGEYAKYFPDIHLVVDWDIARESYYDFYGRKGRSSEHPSNYQLFFRAGLTWSQRTTRKLSVRAYPKDCIFSCKGPVALVKEDNEHELMALLAIMNSSPFLRLVELKLGAAEVAARSYDVGIIQNTPIPIHFSEAQNELAELAGEAYNLTQQTSLGDETTHIFCLPDLLSLPGATLVERQQIIAQIENHRQANLFRIQADIDEHVVELYSVPELGKASTDQSLGDERQIADKETLEEDDDDEWVEFITDPASLVADLLMWCVGVALGRWDVHYALDTSWLPALPEPFDPVPVCSPGMLTGSDGLPMRQDELPSDYPLPVAWDGFLVDDPDHPRDIVFAVEQTLALIWPGKLEEVERQACEILGVPDLRTWLRDPKGFFSYHTKRYSKSRRKAPIYWLLQSAKRNYAIWLYYPRLNSGSLYHAGREYADAKLKLETGRLVDWQRSLVTTSGSARKVQERKIASQEALVADLKAFVKALDAAALLELKPDLNDGVLLNIAPFQELVPWKEAGRVWDELLRGKYEWSSIGKQLRQKGLVKNTNKVKEAD